MLMQAWGAAVGQDGSGEKHPVNMSCKVAGTVRWLPNSSGFDFTELGLALTVAWVINL